MRAITQVESEWDEESRAEALALVEVEADTCLGCGQPVSETTQREAFEGYEASPAVVCNGCRAIDRRHREYIKFEDPLLHLNRYSVTRRWQAEEVNGSHG